MQCLSEAPLTRREADRLNSLRHGAFAVRSDTLECDFAVHGPEIRHTALVQVQDARGAASLAVWWLRWDEDQNTEIIAAPGCEKSCGEEACLLIKDHPGDCDPTTEATPSQSKTTSAPVK